MKSLNDLVSYMKSLNNVWLYGAGKYCRMLISLCRNHQIYVDGIIVTKRDKNPYVIEGRSVYTLDELEWKKIKYEGLNVIVSFLTTKKKSFDDFVGYKFASLLFLTSNIYEELEMMEMQLHYNSLQNDSTMLIAQSYVEPGQAVLYDNNNNEPFARFPARDKDMLHTLLKFGSKKASFDTLGEWKYLPHACHGKISESLGADKQIEIYIITSHYDSMIVDDESKSSKVYIPLQVGAYFTDKRKGCLVDNTGLNISDKNKDYSECTGLYWIWKNTSKQKYVGLNHYRRRLMIDDESLKYIEENDIDVVVSLPELEAGTIKEFLLDYYHFISKFDWDMLKKVIIEMNPEWTGVFERFERGHFYYPCNMCLWKRKWFDKYCGFAYRVAEYIDRENMLRGLYRNDRYMGYLFECMATIFIMANNDVLKVACTEIEWIE